MAGLRYSLVLFGPPIGRRIEPDGGEVELVWRLRRAVHLVAFLALAPDRRAHKDDLIEAIWHDAHAEAIRKNFHPTLTDARRTLAGGSAARDAILFHHGIYRLSSEHDWQVDVETFRRLVDDGKARRDGAPEDACEAWTAAWKLYRGPFLAGGEAPWISALREALRREYIALLQEIGEVSIELGRFTEALDAYRSVLIEEPYEEHVHIRVMELYARLGRRDLVRKQYVRLQEHLKELGVEPLETTQNSYHQLMQQGSAPLSFPRSRGQR